MNTYFCRLIAPRATFLADMSPEEANLMKEHAVYWREWMGKGHIDAFGLVGDPAGAYGIGIVRFADEAAARAFADNDPTIRSGSGFRIEIRSMPFGVVTPIEPRGS